MHLENEMKIPNTLCVWKFFGFGKIPGITTLFLKLTEDDNLTGLHMHHQEGFPYAYLKEKNKTLRHNLSLQNIITG
jgi:hypothetical protein